MPDFLQDKSLLIFGLSTLSVYFLLKSLYRVLDNGRSGVLKLIIYPIKSLPGIEVDQLEIISTGVKYKGFHDRAFMLLNEHKSLVSLRTKPALALISPSFRGDEICLEAPSMPTLRISNTLDVSANELIEFNIWGQDIKGVEYSKEASAWFTRYLNAETKLVKFLPELMNYRKTDIHTEEKLIQDERHPIVYQDECGVALANQSSIDDLNSKLPKDSKVSYRNFRPNILVRPPGAVAFAEDNWKQLQIGSAQLNLAKPCHRCTTTTIIPDRGVKSTKFEPLETLKQYRVKQQWAHLYSNSPIFGLSLAPTKAGTVSVGDPIVVL